MHNKLTSQHPRIAEQYQTYRGQLYSYLTSYTTGTIHTKVAQATEDEVFDTYRDIVDKGKGRNGKRMINMEADIMKPPSSQYLGLV